MYEIEYDENWGKYFFRLDIEVQKRVWKKIDKLEQELPERHLRSGSHFFVAEIGQYRICYTKNEEKKVKKLYFVGKHKEYEKWIGI